MKFSVIIADCPWAFSDKLVMSDIPRGAASNYKTMSISDIKGLPISEITDPNGAILALWVPSTLLQEGLDTMLAWGFKHKQTYIWVKTKKDPLSIFRKGLKKAAQAAVELANLPGPVIKKQLKSFAGALSDRPVNLNDTLSFGMGRLFRQTHEICLLGISNNKIYKKLSNKSQRSVSFAENLKHSAKPENLQDSLDAMFPSESKVEIFARRHRPGWTCLGNEVCDGEDIRESIKRIQLL